MRAVVVQVSVEFLGYQTGLWCRDCMLSTGARFWYVATIGEQQSLRDAYSCLECGRRNIEPAPATVDDGCGS
jgi:hypothetical protein